MKTIKCVLVGDPSIGKTWLATTYITNKNPGGYIPTLFDNFGKHVTFEDKVYSLSLWDTSGQEEFKKMRSLSYQQTDVFILCFSINNVSSFNNVPIWIDKLKEYNVPIILCATKCDLRDEDLVDSKVAEDIVDKYNLYGYVETSAVEFLNVKKVFEVSIEAVVSPQDPKRSNFNCYGLFYCC